LLLSIYLYFIN